MKPNRILLLALAGLVPALAFGVSPKASSSTKNTGRAEVIFLETEKFTDVRSSLNDTGDRNGYLDNLRDHVGKLSGEYLPEGQRIRSPSQTSTSRVTSLPCSPRRGITSA